MVAVFEGFEGFEVVEVEVIEYGAERTADGVFVVVCVFAPPVLLFLVSFVFTFVFLNCVLFILNDLGLFVI